MNLSSCKFLTLMVACLLFLAAPARAGIIYQQPGVFEVWYETSAGDRGPLTLPAPVPVTTNAWYGLVYYFDVDFPDTFFFGVTLTDPDDYFGQPYQPTVYVWEHLDDIGPGALLASGSPSVWVDLGPGEYVAVVTLMPMADPFVQPWGTLPETALSAFVPWAEEVDFTFTVFAPEPGSMLLMLAGLAGLLALRRRGAPA